MSVSTSTLVCTHCGSADIEILESAGHAACVQCGTIIEENTIVSTVEFQESGDRSHVIGQFVSANSTGKPFSSVSRTRGRYGFTRDSRDTTLQNARRVIQQVSSGLHLPTHYVERAHRLYQLALQKNFLFGRRQIHVVATVLYTICRQEKSPHLLIDFSDMLQVNVYKLGQAFLQFIRLLNLKMPLIDPSLYIHRFASRLDLGEKQGAVTATALRAITRFKKDWIVAGRRPDGLCAAAMLIACRAHGFDRMQGEIAKLFRVSGETVKNRLADFRATPAANMTVNEFHNTDHDAEEPEYDPPAFRKNVALETGGAAAAAATAATPRGREDTRKRSSLAIKNRDLQRRSLYGDIYVELGIDAAEENQDNLDERSKQRQLALIAEAQEVVSGVTESGDVTHFGGWGTKKAARVVDNHAQWEININALNTDQLESALALQAQHAMAIPAGPGSASRPLPSGTVALAVSAEPSSSSSSSSSVPSVSLPSSSSSNVVVPTVEMVGALPPRDDGGGQLPSLDDTELSAYLLDPIEQAKKSAIWEKMHQSFLDAREKKKRDKQVEAEERQFRREQNKKSAERQAGRSSTRKKRDASTAGGGGGDNEAQPQRVRSKKFNPQALAAPALSSS